MNTRFVSTLVAFAVLWGCAAEQPQLVTEPGVSLTGYRELEAPRLSTTPARPLTPISSIRLPRISRSLYVARVTI